MANPFVHTELSVDDVKAAQKFYGALFNWKFTELGPDMGNYVMLDFGSKTSGGGIQQKMMPGQPSGWLAYVEVKSVRATMELAEKNGANVIVPYQPIGNMGAIGIFVDPQGAALGLWERGAPPPKAKKAPKKKAAKKTTKKTAKKPASKTAKKAGKKKKAAKR